MHVRPVAIAVLTLLSILAPSLVIAQNNPVMDAAYAAEAAAMGEKCEWIGTGERDVLHLTRDERLAIVAMEDAAAHEQARAIVEQAAMRGAAAACDGPNAEAIRQEIGNAALQQLAVWVARADAYLSFSIDAAWAQDITTLNAQKSEIAAAAAAFSASPDFAPLRARMLNEAQLILTAICPDRQTERQRRHLATAPGSIPARGQHRIRSLSAPHDATARLLVHVQRRAGLWRHFHPADHRSLRRTRPT